MYFLWLIIREHDSVCIDSFLRMGKLKRNEKIAIISMFSPFIPKSMLREQLTFRLKRENNDFLLISRHLKYYNFV